MNDSMVALEVFVVTQADTGFDPEMCPTITGACGSRLIRGCSSLSRLKRDMKYVSKDYSNVRAIRVRDVLTNIPSNYGIVVNPSIEYSIELQPDDLVQLKFERS